MEERKIIENLNLSDLPKPYREIAEVVGLDTYIDLLEYFGGGFIYFPTLRTAIKETLYKKLLSEYNGFNKRELMQKYDISESTMHRLIKSQLTNRGVKHE